MKTNQVGHAVRVVVMLAIATSTLIGAGCGKSRAKREYEAWELEEEAKERMRSEREARFQQEEEAREANRIAASERERQEAEKEQLDEDRQVQEERRVTVEKDRQAKILKERELAAYADKRFAEISMEPKVLLSPRAKAMNFTFAFTGKDLQTYKKYLADKKWHGIMKLLNHTEEYDDKSSIDFAVQDLKEKPFQFLVKINPGSLPRGKFSYLPLPSIDDPDANWYGAQGDHETVWENHPDGNGVMHEWIPADREIMILVSDNPYSWEKGNVNQARREIDTQFGQGVEKLARKKELGEIDETAFNAQLRELKVQKRNAYLALLNRF
jgi:hypothetical protein